MTGPDGPFFLITIDTEGDNLWAAPREITTRNSRFLPRFQALCETYGFKPTYLTDYEMACCPVFREFARGVQRRGTGEIGMHLHAWNSPPLRQLTEDDYRYQPYLVEYPEAVIREKVDFLTRLLEDTFGTAMISHRAGRWSMNEVYARVLAEQGYQADCSVTPHVSWNRATGDPGQRGGSDFSDFPEAPYTVDLQDISRAGQSSLLEVPMTIMRSESRVLPRLGQLMPRGSLPERAWNRMFPRVHWLRPNGRNLRQMLRLLKRALRERRPYAEFMLHSSELMPGGSPTFRSRESIEHLYRDLEALFSTAAKNYAGATLSEFGQYFRAAQSSQVLEK